MQFKATDFPVYPPGDYLCGLEVIEEGTRSKFGVKNPTDNDKVPCFNFNFVALNVKEPLVKGEFNTVINPKTDKPVQFSLQTSDDAGSARAGLRKALQWLAGRDLSKEEIRGLDADNLAKCKGLFTVSVSKALNENTKEFVNKVTLVQPANVKGVKAFKIDPYIKEVSGDIDDDEELDMSLLLGDNFSHNDEGQPSIE